MSTSLKMPLTALALAGLWACADSRQATGPRLPSFSRAVGDGSPGALYAATNATTGNEVSVFAVESDGLELTDRVSSGGEQPVSVTAFRGLVYVLNAGGAGNITGF